ncbi:MAG: DUF4261 domain-containing protein [Planctomycetes bacterium]|nr:DUF4261 domain-containing protein [Planctomycetota bacterium]
MQEAEQATPEQGSGAAVAFVLTSAPGCLTAEAVRTAHATIAPAGPALVLQEGEGDVLMFALEGVGTVFVAAMPTPVPGGEAEAAAQHSLCALGTGWELPPHAAHLIVGLSPEASAPGARGLLALTRVVAAVAEASQAVGVYWGAGGVAHPRDFFVDSVRELGDDDLPLPLWLGVSVAAEGDEVSLLSRGFRAQFGLPDLLLWAPRGAGGDGLELLFDLLLYVARRGQPIPAGETVGRTEEERLPVEVVPSPIDPATEVWSVRFPGAAPRLGDLRLRAPRTLEELSGGAVARSWDLAEWAPTVVTGRRWGCAALTAGLATGLVFTALSRAWPWLALAVPFLVLALLLLAALREKRWLVLRRGDEQVVLHLWHAGEGEPALAAFVATVLSASNTGGDEPKPNGEP